MLICAIKITNTNIRHRGRRLISSNSLGRQLICSYLISDSHDIMKSSFIIKVDPRALVTAFHPHVLLFRTGAYFDKNLIYYEKIIRKLDISPSHDNHKMSIWKLQVFNSETKLKAQKKPVKYNECEITASHSHSLRNPYSFFKITICICVLKIDSIFKNKVSYYLSWSQWGANVEVIFIIGLNFH